MVLTPEPMQRALIVSSKGHQAQVIETLHKLRVAHFIDYHEQPGEFAEFKLGTPLANAGPASERLVRVRAILRHLGLEGSDVVKTTTVATIEQRLNADLDRIEREVNHAYESREALRTSLQEGRELEVKLAPLAVLPLRLEDYRGYESITVFVGRADPAFKAALSAAAPDALLVESTEGGLFAVFAPKNQAEAASEALYKNGFAEVEIPAGTGAPAERISQLQQERATIDQRTTGADAELARLGEQHRDLLLAAEEHLTILVEKAEAPLSFASSENAFVVDAWIPASQMNVVDAALRQATYGNVHFQLVETGKAHTHGHGENGAHADAAFDAGNGESHHVDKREEPPTKYDNPKATQRFEWFTELFATPRYDEIDPTTIFAFFFPLFFGFMVGDLGLGLLIAAIGWLLIAKLPRVDGMKQLGTAFVLAGLIAAIFGGLVFHDALGIPFGFTEHMTEEITKHNEELVAAGESAITMGCNPETYKVLGETTWGCLFGGNAWHSEPVIGKVTDIPTMLLLSLAAAGVHMLLGLVLGIRNEIGHGAKHVAAKAGFLLLLIAFYPAAVALLNATFWTDVTGLTAGTAYIIAGVGFLIGAVILGWAEGASGVLEIPTIFSNILSYLRLGAVAIAKGAMAVAFNNLTLVAALSGTAIAVKVLGIIGFVIAQVALLVLGILSGGIQALRLNFVEFYTKFYKGGGKPYRPFGRVRRSSTGAPTLNPSTSTLVTNIME